MIPSFPEFKALELSDKTQIEKITKNFLPYSDFNFTSLFCWDTDSSIKISMLNNNLVVDFSDYITNKHFLSFIGKHKPLDTAIDLLTYSKERGLLEELRLIPSEVADAIKQEDINNQLDINSDQDNSDYILSVEKLVNMRTNEFRGKKNLINQFKQNYKDQFNIFKLDPSNPHDSESIITIFDHWETSRKKDRKDTQNELLAIKKLLKYQKDINPTIIAISINNIPAAFSINEITWQKYGVIHFEKADINFAGIFQFLKIKSAEDFLDQGCEFINYEQDLGIPGLKNAKKMYHPVKYLNKYIIKLS